MNFEIVCDSSADLPEEEAKAAHITVVPFYVSVDGENYLREGSDISIIDFYKSMSDDPECFPKTSTPAVQDYIDTFLPLVKEGRPILCICLTKKFSSSMQTALNAKAAIEDEYKDAKIYVMDSQLVTALQGLLVKEAVRLRDKGLTLEEAVPLLEGIRSTGHIFFTTKDLKYLEHGGRLGKAAYTAGSLLNLKPILHFCDGELAPVEVCPGRRKSLHKVTDKFFNFLKEHNMDLKGYYFGTGIGLDIPEYADFIAELEERFEIQNIWPDEWIKIRIGATIGVHTGPYPIGLGILKKCDI